MAKSQWYCPQPWTTNVHSSMRQWLWMHPKFRICDFFKFSNFQSIIITFKWLGASAGCASFWRQHLSTEVQIICTHTALQCLISFSLTEIFTQSFTQLSVDDWFSRHWQQIKIWHSLVLSYRNVEQMSAVPIYDRWLQNKPATTQTGVRPPKTGRYRYLSSGQWLI